MQNKSIKNWANDDKPREKLSKNGAASLSNTELLAILIGTGSGSKSAIDLGREIMNTIDNDLVRFNNITPKQLEQIKGIGPAKAITIAAAIELGIRIKSADFKNIAVVKNSAEIAQILKSLYGHYSHEIFAIVCLNNANRILSNEILSEGGLNNTSVDVRLLFKSALLHNATSIILCHNHPSGNIQPSKTDHKLTHKIIEAGAKLDIKVIDHIIVSPNGYYSMLDEETLHKTFD